MPGSAAQIRDGMEPAEVESGGHGGRTQQAEAMHAHDEHAHRLIGWEEAVEEWAGKTERLIPPVRSFADRVVQVFP